MNLELSDEETARGHADARERGVRFGRKPKLTPHQQREAIKKARRGRRNAALDSAHYNVSPQTIPRLAV
jgi:DNA invertase Pin-like site-specific DNA recombinase